MLKFLLSFAMSILLTQSALGEALYIVHGIDGRDLGFAAELPVDIIISGNCVLKDAKYKQVIGPVAVIPSAQEIQIRRGNGNCTGGLLITKRIDIPFGEIGSVVAHLNAEGVPAVTHFANDLRPTDRANARAIIRHTAGVPEVTVRLFPSTRGLSRRLTLLPIANGEQQQVEVIGGEYRATVRDSLPRRGSLYGQGQVSVPADKVGIIYAVGSAKRTTFSFILQLLDSNP